MAARKRGTERDQLVHFPRRDRQSETAPGGGADPGGRHEAPSSLQSTLALRAAGSLCRRGGDDRVDRRRTTSGGRSGRQGGDRDGLEPRGSCLRWRCPGRSEEHTSELQSQSNLVCRLLLEKKKKI